MSDKVVTVLAVDYYTGGFRCPVGEFGCFQYFRQTPVSAETTCPEHKVLFGPTTFKEMVESADVVQKVLLEIVDNLEAALIKRGVSRDHLTRIRMVGED